MERQGTVIWNVSDKRLTIDCTDWRCESVAMSTGRNSQHIRMLNAGDTRGLRLKIRDFPQMAAKTLGPDFVVGTK